MSEGTNTLAGLTMWEWRDRAETAEAAIKDAHDSLTVWWRMNGTPRDTDAGACDAHTTSSFVGDVAKTEDTNTSGVLPRAKMSRDMSTRR